MAQGISFGHFNIIGGSVREDGPYVSVVEDRAPAESVADLYLTLEPVSPAGAALCAELTALIAGQFGRPQYSLTGNLLQALRASQEHLRGWNKAAPPDRQAAVGATCLAISGDQAYLAQAGPGLLYFRHDGLLRRFQAIEADAQAPLGTRIACSPEFNHFELSQGDTILLVSSRFASIVDDQQVDYLLSLPAGEALPEIYKLARRETEFTALYLAMTGSLQRPRPAYAADEEAVTRPYPTGRRGSGGSHMEAARSEESVRPTPPGRRAPAPQSGLRTSYASSGWLAKRRDLERLTEHHSLSVPRPALYTVAAVIALTLVGWLGVPHLLETGRQDRFDFLTTEIRQSETTAAGTQGVAQKRALLDRAQADLIEARTLRPSDPQLTALGSRLQGELQTLDQVRQFPSLQTVVNLSTTTIAARSVNELAAAGRVYVLDSDSGKVFAFDPNGGTPGTPVFQPGMDVESIETGPAVHMTAAPASGGQPGSLYILDSNRRLFALDASGTLQTVGIADASAWKSATAIAEDGKSLYVLDSAGNQIWRFDAGGAGFTAPPVALLAKADLSDAVQLSVSGQVYVATANGKLEMVRDGHLASVSISGLDHPLLSPQPPVADAASSSLLVADAANQRIVVTDAADTYEFQYAGANLQGLRVISVDSTTGRLYALCGESIMSTPLH